MSFSRLLMSAALAGAMAWITPPCVAAESSRAALVAVDNVDVEQVAELGAGVPLVFTVFGTPQSLATLRIEGARRVLELRETDAGVYEGTYVIDAHDAIRPDSRVTATLQRQGAAGHARLDEPLLLSSAGVPWNLAGADVVAAAPTTAPAGRPVPIAVAPLPVPIGVAPRPVPMGVASQPVPPAVVGAAPPRASDREPCSECAFVESVQAIAAPPRGGVVGAVGGAIAGAILGKELGEAHTRRVLSVLGAIGGAITGREIERRATASTQYDVVLRLADGTRLKRRYEQAPNFGAGDTIRLGAPVGRGGPVPASY